MKQAIIFLLLGLPFQTANSQTEECTLCEDGTAIPVERHNHPLHLESIGTQSCLQLERAASSYLVDDPTCDLVRALGPLCGCSLNLTIRTNRGCKLCPEGGNLTNATHILPGLSGFDILPLKPSFLQIDEVSCEILQSALFTNHNPASAFCHKHQMMYAKECGCPAFEENETMNVNEASDLNETNATPPEGSCSLCWDGSPILYPDLEIPFINTNYPPNETCGGLNGMLQNVSREDLWCQEAQGVGLYCGCPSPPPQSICSFCPNGESVPRPSRVLNWLDEWTWLDGLFPDDAVATCIQLEIITQSSLDSQNTLNRTSTDPVQFDVLCFASQLRSWICGCSPDWKQITLTWSYRTSGILSLLGSLSIIVSVLRKKRKNRFSTYHQLILSICVFDCISSFFYTMVGVMAPVEDGFYLSRGNYDTCKAQAFMIQLGHQTSMFYNMCLSLYFLLVISYNWKEYQFQKYMPYIHGTVIILGLGLAFGALPFYGPQLGVCGILQPPARTVTWWPVSLLFTLPLSIVLLTMACSTAMVCHKVYRQQKKAMRWSLQQSSATAHLSKRVFWQSFWYVMAFYVTVPFLLLSYYFRFSSPGSFWILIGSAVLGPSQGVMNTFVYFHRLTSNKKADLQPAELYGFRRFFFRFRRFRWWTTKANVLEERSNGSDEDITSVNMTQDDVVAKMEHPNDEMVVSSAEAVATVITSRMSDVEIPNDSPRRIASSGSDLGTPPPHKRGGGSHQMSSTGSDYLDTLAMPPPQGERSSSQSALRRVLFLVQRNSNMSQDSTVKRSNKRSNHDLSGVLEHWLLNVESRNEKSTNDDCCNDENPANDEGGNDEGMENHNQEATSS